MLLTLTCGNSLLLVMLAQHVLHASRFTRALGIVLFAPLAPQQANHGPPKASSPAPGTTKRSAGTTTEAAELQPSVSMPTYATSAVKPATHVSNVPGVVQPEALLLASRTTSLSPVYSYPHVSLAPTPLNVQRFSRMLRNHPDKQLVSHILNGLQSGFNIGFAGPRNVNVMSSNLPSAAVHSEFISEHLAASCSRGETAGPFSSPPFPFMHCSEVGAVPKKIGKLRMIHHLSSPEGESVDDGIPAEPFSLHYDRIDDAINLIMTRPQPVYLSKLDIKSAFRQIPVCRDDFPLLGIYWKGSYFYERVLPFGLRSSPAIFDSVASVVEWILHHEFSIGDLLHYLDDFLNITSGELIATLQLAILLRAFNYLGIPLAPAKIEGPATTLTFLGITLDCHLKEARLSADKLTELKSLVSAAINRGHITQHELESLLGKLSFAARVIVPTRTFMRRLWAVCHRYQKRHYTIKLSEECLEDLHWWMRLLHGWNGKSFFLHPKWVPSPDLQLYTDASGTIGWGAYFNARLCKNKKSFLQLLPQIMPFF